MKERENKEEAHLVVVKLFSVFSLLVQLCELESNAFPIGLFRTILCFSVCLLLLDPIRK